MKQTFCRKIVALLLMLTVALSASFGVFAREFFPFEESTEGPVEVIVEKEDATPYDTAINAVCGLGFMDRNTDTIFGINDKVTYDTFKDIVYRISYREYSFENGSDYIDFDSVAECLVDTLGYTPIATADKYHYAQTLGIFNNANPKRGADVTKAQLAQIIYNTINIELCEQRAFGDTITYEVVAGKTLLFEKDIKELRGFVNANSYLNLYSNTVCAEGKIQINRSTYKFSENIAAENFIGQHVIAYIDFSNTKDETVIYVMQDPAKPETTVLKVNAKNKALVYADGIEYNKKKYRVSSGAFVIDNHKFSGTYSVGSVSPKVTGQCKVELYDSNEDGTYDIVSINKIKNYVVKQFVKFSDIKYKITDKLNQPEITINLDNNSSVYVSKNGAAVEIETIKIGDVLSIMESDSLASGKKIFKIDISQDFVEGKIASVSSDGITLDNGNTYYPTDKFVQPNDLSLAYKFSLTYDGLVAYADKSTTSAEQFGFLVGAESSDWTSDDASFKIYTTDGEFVVYNCKSKITFIDGDTVTFGVPATGVKLTPREVAEHSAIKNKAIAVKYQINDDDEIIKLATPSDNSATGKIDTENFSIDYKGEVRCYNDYYSGRFRSVGSFNKISVPLKAGETTVTATSVDVTKEEEFGIPSFANNQRPKVILYDVLPSGGLSSSTLMVTSVAKKTSVALKNDNIAVIKGFSQALVDDEPCTVIELYKKTGVETKIYVEDMKDGLLNASERTGFTYDKNDPTNPANFLPEDLKPGDIIQYELNAGDVLAAFRLLCRTTEVDDPLTVDTNERYYEYCYDGQLLTPNELENLGSLTHGFAKVMAVDIVGKSVSIATNFRADPVTDYLWNRAITVSDVVCYNTADNTMTKISANEILVGDEAFYLHHYGYGVKTVIIVR